MPLADGSSVTLNTSSRISVAFNGGQRIIRFLEGEALFNVVNDRTRAFLVQAGMIEVGDQFDGKSPVSLGSNSGVEVAANGVLSFEDAPLDQTASQFARYSDPLIILDDKSLRQETVTGLFSATDPQGFVQAVAKLLNLRSHKAADGLHLTRS